MKFMVASKLFLTYRRNPPPREGLGEVFNLNNSSMALPRGFRFHLPFGEVGIAFLQFRVGQI